MDLLIAVGTSAWLYSAIVVFEPGFLEQDVLYFMESMLIIGLILLGRMLEQLVKNRASEAIENILDLQPLMARVLRDGAEVEVPLRRLGRGYLAG